MYSSNLVTNYCLFLKHIIFTYFLICRASHIIIFVFWLVWRVMTKKPQILCNSVVSFERNIEEQPRRKHSVHRKYNIITSKIFLHHYSNLFAINLPFSMTVRIWIRYYGKSWTGMPWLYRIWNTQEFIINHKRILKIQWNKLPSKTFFRFQIKDFGFF